jgi:hypothetical protein
LVTITEVTDNFPFTGKVFAPEMDIALPRIFCGVPGDINTYGVGRKKASNKISRKINCENLGTLTLNGESWRN